MGAFDVLVTIKKRGSSSLDISVDKPRLLVANGVSPTLTWTVDKTASDSGATITDVAFQTVVGGGHNAWVQGHPVGASGKFSILDRNLTKTDAGLFKYAVSAAVGATTGTLDPEVDNQPPPEPLDDDDDQGQDHKHGHRHH